MNNKLIDEINVDNIFKEIKGLIESSRNRVYSTFNTEMINLYFNNR